MASNITLSAGVRANLLSLQKTANLMSTTQTRLATGKKVNTALDNPVNFFTASSLHSRSTDLSALLDSMSNGIKTLEAADNGLTSITSTQTRLATGKKVNTALDNPVNFFTASSLHSRSTDLSALLDSMSNGIKTLEAADNGLTSITSTLQSMKPPLQQPRQDKSFQTASYTVDSTALGTPSAKNLAFSGGAVGSTPVNIALNVADVAAT